jgi:membrane protease YdiL (CAAX protease family)
MQTETGIHPEPQSRTSPTERSQRDIALEVGVVLLVAVVPDLFNSFASLRWSGQAAPPSMSYMALSLVFRSLQVVAPVLLLVRYRSGDWAELGLQRPRIVRDGLLGTGVLVVSFIAVYACFYPAYYGLYFVLGPDAAAWLYGEDGQAASRAAMEAPTAWHLFLLFPLMSLANGFAEELVVRGHLLPNFERLTGSSLVALLITTALFAGYHAYQGPYGVLSTGVIGLVYGAVFLATRRLWPLVLAHAATDLLAVIFS